MFYPHLRRKKIPKLVCSLPSSEERLIDGERRRYSRGL